MMAVLGLALAQPAPAWAFIGVTRSGLRMFVDRASVRGANGMVEATVRLGSPGSIVGTIVEVTERDQLDCTNGRWRMLAFEAFDADGAVVQRGGPAGEMLPVQAGSMGEAIRDAVCAGEMTPKGKD